MPDQIERELKLELPDLAAHDRLLAVIPNHSGEWLQTNMYFDTGEFRLLRRGAMLRVRIEERPDRRRVTATLKIAIINHDGYIEAREIEAPFTNELMTDPGGVQAVAALPRSVRDRLANLTGGEPIRMLGSTSNARLLFTPEEQCQAALDHTIFSNGDEDYELEIEGPSMERSRLLADRWLLAAGVTCGPQRKTKYQRFLERSHPRARWHFHS
ncbi:CYTH domain-containing protein [bacterium]|nr:CYTH domain-containing protein [candidate division CSSED10-310 bacterium]